MQRAGDPHRRERRADGRIRSSPRRMGRSLLTPSSSRMRIWNSAWTLLVLANLLWAGNIVLGRGMVGHGAADHTRLLALDRSVPDSHRFRVAIPAPDWRVLLGRWRLMLLLVRHRHRDLQHDVLHRTDLHHGAQRPAAAIRRPADHHHLGLRTVPRSSDRCGNPPA